ncbi:hypothetical protein L915_08767 [Phytophthora nicotianae]|uniref:Uncharacterized protein n=1 Tax=Phytophthora nicotianae TaxID=4792 RepID=W2J341_PHYNI|nr:hypothetical protein L915_08767 [Phytophthora nicotianae]ETL40041.1 hypothetical protein L916_08695 [Phytophthora nicotianae]ETL40043.1 hypothetical protein L916_08694 [Phytophthora nicotianae]ETM46466.1 hypothetical protein L914_08646 [Phytophthora nicotianae]
MYASKYASACPNDMITQAALGDHALAGPSVDKI